MLTRSIPIIDIAPLVAGDDATAVADQISLACRTAGFFYIIGHGVDVGMQQRLEQLSRQFFAQDLATKMKIRMPLGGIAWRGYFPLGNELTSGRADQKEGIYFGSELAEDHPRVRARTPLHGGNLFPDIPGFRLTVLQYIDALTSLGHALMRGIALSLELDPSYFHRRYTAEPTILFRIFHYPPTSGADSDTWGVGEHTDYGLLTILRQDDLGGLQVKSGEHWMEATPLENAFVCNIGDMLDRITGGLYRSTPHRVRNRAARGRYSFPFFFDPGFDAEIQPIFPRLHAGADAKRRWDGADLQQLSGTYGQYLLRKVAKVFPQLRSALETPGT